MKNALEASIILNEVLIVSFLWPRGEVQCISKDATYTASSVSKNRFHSVLMTSEGPLYDEQFAFHTNKIQDLYIIIDLCKLKKIESLYIKNRTGPPISTQEGGVSVWLSNTSEFEDQPDWKAEKTQNDWTVKLPQTTSSRFIKLGLLGKNKVFHLAQVKVFGWDK
ncbi:hypothetical protein PQO01_21000 [Lentisphaera marina]|uniref:hypothetical protein n=1 Tax=Lentisphaera marina TaxID=1111041 RepID=UPI002366EB8F|nr:hypothetical protein [Lentisphaera marina]MDD7987438.1 hypothetical protein [Lentisphaera marina]